VVSVDRTITDCIGFFGYFWSVRYFPVLKYRGRCRFLKISDVGSVILVNRPKSSPQNKNVTTLRILEIAKVPLLYLAAKLIIYGPSSFQDVQISL